MLTIAKNLYDYRELMATIAWRNITMRYKQAYLGIAWASRENRESVDPIDSLFHDRYVVRNQP